MKKYCVTGAASGIGAALSKRLKDEGNNVITVDMRDADIVADLSTAAGCKHFDEQINNLVKDGLDGFVPCAGVGTHLPGETIVAVNYTAVIKTTLSALEALKKNKGTIVLISSNSAPMQVDNKKLCDLLVDGKYEEAQALGKKSSGIECYAGTKKALVYWMRKHCAEWVKAGVRSNAIAPGMTMTPMVEQQFEHPDYKKSMNDFRDMIPMGVAQTDDIVNGIMFLLSEQSRYCCGSLLFVDGGIDALLRNKAL